MTNEQNFNNLITNISDLNHDEIYEKLYNFVSSKITKIGNLVLVMNKLEYGFEIIKNPENNSITFYYKGYLFDKHNFSELFSEIYKSNKFSFSLTAQTEKYLREKKQFFEVYGFYITVPDYKLICISAENLKEIYRSLFNGSQGKYKIELEQLVYRDDVNTLMEIFLDN